MKKAAKTSMAVAGAQISRVVKGMLTVLRVSPRVGAVALKTAEIFGDITLRLGLREWH
jgi:hypothetical protein